MPDCLYLDCFSGISGDMFLAVLFDLGLSPRLLNQDLGHLKLAGLSISKRRVVRAGLAGTQARVHVPDQAHHRDWGTIRKLLTRAPLSPGVKDKALAVFQNLAECEARIHGQAVETVHFHEVGGLDAVADIVGVCAGLERLGIRTLLCSPVNVGSGRTESQHGSLPVPAPATLELLKGFTIYANGPQVELATPTGAALLRTLAQPVSAVPTGRVKHIGYGAGSRDFPAFPNLVRAWWMEGETGPGRQDEVAVLTTHVDDASPQIMGYLMDQLLEQGALDVAVSPVWMKKNRPGQRLEVICPPEKARQLADVIFRELPTLGIRLGVTRRLVLERSMETITLRRHAIRIKRAVQPAGGETIIPEYEDAKICALHSHLPLRQVLDEAREYVRRNYERRK
jgi:uncharacterized protein (TIGR00299 family) protein